MIEFNGPPTRATIGLLIAIASSVVSAAAQDKPPAQIVAQLGHSGVINAVAFSPDGRFAVSGSGDSQRGELKLWDVAVGKELRNFAGHNGDVQSVAFSPDGRLILSGSDDETLKLWDVATGSEVRTFSGHSSQAVSVAFSRDGHFALSGSADKTLKLWDIVTGKELRTFAGHGGTVTSVSFSPDMRFALSGSADNALKLWDLATGLEVRTFSGHDGSVASVAFSPDGRLVLSGSSHDTGLNVRLWDAETGVERRFLASRAAPAKAVAFSPDGRLALSGGSEALEIWEVATGTRLREFSGQTDVVSAAVFSPDSRFVAVGNYKAWRLWDVATGQLIRAFRGYTNPVESVAFSPDGRFLLSGACDSEPGAVGNCTRGAMRLLDAATGIQLRSFSGRAHIFQRIRFSPDGRLALTGSCNLEETDDGYCVKSSVKLWELTTGRELRSFGLRNAAIPSLAFSPDGRLALSSSDDNTISIWEVGSGRILRSLRGHRAAISALAFSSDGRTARSSGYDHSVILWDVGTGKKLRTIKRSDGIETAFSSDGRHSLSIDSLEEALVLWEVDTGNVRRFLGHKDTISSVAFSPDGRFALSGHESTLRMWELASGRELRTFVGHTGKVNSVAFSPDSRFALSGSSDGTTRIWDTGTGHELARMLAGQDRDWLVMTPPSAGGFFTGLHRDTDMLAIARGMDVTMVGQVYQSLFNPDLVREAFASDPRGEVQRAARKIDLEKVLDSGPPPIVSITSHGPVTRTSMDLVSVTARITDRGTGIGRIEWRVNGITAGVSSLIVAGERSQDVKQELALDPGENQIEVIAYNERNLLASVPARTTIILPGAAGGTKPRLHILAIGINAYVDKGWAPPGKLPTDLFPPLSLAVGDAKGFAAEMKKAAVGFYDDDVRITLVLDAEATAAALDQHVQRISAEIHPRDTFVFFAAAHGYSESGRFFLIPQDYQGGSNPEKLASGAIGQDRLQDWIANRIKARKAIILLDTCESGALVNGTPSSEAAMGRLHEATGRPVLTAAAAGQDALEGDELGHGVFTASLIEALHKGDANGNGRIEISELAAYVAKRVPELAEHIGELAAKKGVRNGSGVRVAAHAGIAMSNLKKDKQSARYGSTGEDFAVVNRLP